MMLLLAAAGALSISLCTLAYVYVDDAFRAFQRAINQIFSPPGC